MQQYERAVKGKHLWKLQLSLGDGGGKVGVQEQGRGKCGAPTEFACKSAQCSDCFVSRRQPSEEKMQLTGQNQDNRIFGQISPNPRNSKIWVSK